MLAGGSNVVIGDAGFPGDRGAAPHPRRRRRRPRTTERDRTRGGRASRGTSSSRPTVAAGWSGVECLSGIPGSAGATPIQNVGAYGQEVAETIVAVRGLRPGHRRR